MKNKEWLVVIFSGQSDTNDKRTIRAIMNHLRPFIISLTILSVSCQDKDVNFGYKVMKSESGILVENYDPVTREQLTRYLTKVNDTLKLKDLNVFLKAEDIQKINPEFKKKYYRGYFGKMDLSSFQNDTIRAMKNLNLHIGTFKEKNFIKNDDWDSLLLNNKFFKRIN